MGNRAKASTFGRLMARLAFFGYELFHKFSRWPRHEASAKLLKIRKIGSCGISRFRGLLPQLK